jgi:hypothetical protein
MRGSQELPRHPAQPTSSDDPRLPVVPLWGVLGTNRRVMASSSASGFSHPGGRAGWAGNSSNNSLEQNGVNQFTAVRGHGLVRDLHPPPPCPRLDYVAGKTREILHAQENHFLVLTIRTII